MNPSVAAFPTYSKMPIAATMNVAIFSPFFFDDESIYLFNLYGSDFLLKHSFKNSSTSTTSDSIIMDVLLQVHKYVLIVTHGALL